MIVFLPARPNDEAIFDVRISRFIQVSEQVQHGQDCGTTGGMGLRKTQPNAPTQVESKC
jgi:hypothetical protein